MLHVLAGYVFRPLQVYACDWYMGFGLLVLLSLTGCEALQVGLVFDAQAKVLKCSSRFCIFFFPLCSVLLYHPLFLPKSLKNLLSSLSTLLSQYS